MRGWPTRYGIESNTHPSTKATPIIELNARMWAGSARGPTRICQAASLAFAFSASESDAFAFSSSW